MAQDKKQRNGNIYNTFYLRMKEKNGASKTKYCPIKMGKLLILLSLQKTIRKSVWK